MAIKNFENKRITLPNGDKVSFRTSEEASITSPTEVRSFLPIASEQKKNGSIFSFQAFLVALLIVKFDLKSINPSQQQTLNEATVLGYLSRMKLELIKTTFDEDDVFAVPTEQASQEVINDSLVLHYLGEIFKNDQLLATAKNGSFSFFKLEHTPATV